MGPFCFWVKGGEKGRKFWLDMAVAVSPRPSFFGVLVEGGEKVLTMDFAGEG